MPLSKSFDLLDTNDLGPYEIVAKVKIENDEIVAELGTEDYIQWVLEDTSVSLDSPVRRVLLFVTYYELPDRVPHVPEECYTGGGYQRLVTDAVEFTFDYEGTPTRVPGRFLLFGRTDADLWGTRGTFPVMYFFKVNGEYANSRDDARVTLNRNLFGKASYFSKVEMVFNRTNVAPKKDQAVEAASRLLSVVLSKLERDHWPKWPPETDTK